ncbi:hypothetical protein GCM10028817_11790 [Spirosoma pomorum]
MFPNLGSCFACIVSVSQNRLGYVVVDGANTIKTYHSPKINEVSAGTGGGLAGGSGVGADPES